LLATECVEESVVNNAPAVEVMEVDSNGLASTLVANELTLVDFTAVW